MIFSSLIYLSFVSFLIIIPNINWKSLTFSKESFYKPYVGETHTQKVFFVQSDDKVNGNGEKWEYNGKLLDFSAHRKLEYEGTVNGKEFKTKYIMYGKDRVSAGIMTVELSNDDNTMTGIFSGTAASATGTVTGEKVI